MTVVRQVGIKEEHLEMLPCDTESVLLGNICRCSRSATRRGTRAHTGGF